MEWNDDHRKSLREESGINLGGSGIGLVKVEMLSRCGPTVAAKLLTRDEGKQSATAGYAVKGLEVIAMPGDISDVSNGSRMVDATLERLHGLGIPINNAGNTVAREPGPFSDLDTKSKDFWEQILQTNLLGALRCTRALANALREAKGPVD